MDKSFNREDFADVFLFGLKNALPEIAVAFSIVSSDIENLEFTLLCLLLLVKTVLLRAVWNTSILIHGLGHVTIAAIVDRQPNFINLVNILEHRTISEIFRSLVPGSPILIPFFPDRNYPWVTAGNAEPWRIRIKALGGIAFNLIAIGIGFAAIPSGIAFGFLDAPFLRTIFIGANLLIIISSRSDIVAFINGTTNYINCFNCGNFGFLGIKNASDGENLLPARFLSIYKKMGRETEVRGEQAGGGFVSARDRNDDSIFVGKKIVNSKRDNLTKSLEAAFAPVRRKAIREGLQPLPSLVKGVWHYRYGTSSAPSILETHWHEWIDTRSANVWQVENGQWVCRRQKVNHRITHNGDFDAYKLFEKSVETDKLGLWLERVLHTANATQGDSPKIAGMMDLLIAKGMWDASVRLAYQLAVAESFEEVFGGEKPAKDASNLAPSQKLLASWTDIFERVFECYTKILVNLDEFAFQKYLYCFEKDILRLLKKDNAIGQWSLPKQVAFVKTAIQAFLHNDPFMATKIFMSKAEGSFGLVVASTLDEERLVLSAKHQPISIGMNCWQKYAIYASEPAAINAVLFGLPESWRLDLDRQGGEIALLAPNKLSVYSMRSERELHESELMSRQIAMADNPYIQSRILENEDPIERDIQEIPQILRKIEIYWRDCTSFNRQSADYLVDLLIAKAEHWQEKRKKVLQAGLELAMRQSTTVDFLMTGTESSLWVGERFAQDLKTIFPNLTIKVISSNELLKVLQHDFSSLQLGEKSIALAISQSGQTFSTLEATDILEQLRQQGIIGEVFILTEELNSLMGAAIGQDYNTGAAFCRRIFTTNSGRRTAEPCTLATAALHQTLTTLLFYLAKRMRRQCPQFNPLGMILTPQNILTLESIKDEFLDRSIVSIIGTDDCGRAIASKEHQKLLDLGKRWAQHVTETPLAWAIHALYILISVGWTIPFGHKLPLAKTLFNLILWSFNLQSNAFLLTFVAPVVILIDIAIYVFGPWLWTIGLRNFQGRQLLARTGKRTLIVGDLPWVHKLLKSYISKLFSLSYGIASLEVHSDDPQDQMLHHFGHRVVRGTLIFLGVPDGRRGGVQKEEENATIMTGKQANGVRNFGVGPEILALGHNPKIRERGFDETMILWSDIDSSSPKVNTPIEEKEIVEKLRESRFSSFERLLAGYVLFWALAKKVASFPLLTYQYWKSQSRTKIMTTAAPISGVNLNKLEKKSGLGDRLSNTNQLVNK